jgi:hypothetical protein
MSAGCGANSALTHLYYDSEFGFENCLARRDYLALFHQDEKDALVRIFDVGLFRLRRRIHFQNRTENAPFV